MQINVYDTYVKAGDGHTMHFDVYTAIKDEKKAVEYARKFVDSKGEKNAKVTASECQFCHSQSTTPEIEAEIKKNGYYIYKMGGC
jgi:lipopolysaccharide biosynthesis regulator YciM